MKFTKSLKKIFKRIKYYDKTKTRFFTSMIVISAFTLFIGSTYSYFAITEHLNAATIAIANLKYTLSSPSDRFNIDDMSIQVNSGETLELELVLKSLNTQSTKYALDYTSDNENAKVYYSEKYKNNMSGIIGITNSEISLHIIIVNTSTSSQKVNLTPKGGYLQNTIVSNITEGYYPNDADIVVRTTLLNEDLSVSYSGEDFPAKDGEYTYFKTDCSSNTTAQWDNETWSLSLDNIEEKTSCEVYFKKMASDIETYFQITDTNGTKTYVDTIPNNGSFTFNKVICNNDSQATWDNEAWKLNINGMSDHTICIAEFTKN